MASIYEFIGERIKERREGFRKGKLSQEQLAQEMGTTANTISRWETGVYRPSVEDLEKLAKFFDVAVSSFFPSPPPQEYPFLQSNPLFQSLLSATGKLREKDLQDLIDYAEYRNQRRQQEQAKGKRKPAR
jgi:transcriptional regulator with XRE-family HTH domain